MLYVYLIAISSCPPSSPVASDIGLHSEHLNALNIFFLKCIQDKFPDRITG